MPPPSYADLDREGVEIIEERSPTLLLDGMVLVTGQVDRVTDFEKRFPTTTGTYRSWMGTRYVDLG